MLIIINDHIDNHSGWHVPLLEIISSLRARRGINNLDQGLQSLQIIVPGIMQNQDCLLIAVMDYISFAIFLD